MCELKTQVDSARADLQAQIKSHVHTEKLFKNNPALQDEVAAKFNQFFASHGIVRCQEVLSIK